MVRLRSPQAPSRRPFAERGVVTFASIHHPGAARRAALFVQAQGRFVGTVLLVVMVAGLAAALEGHAILWPVVWATVGGYALASVGAQWWLRETVAEVELTGGLVVFRSVWEAAPGVRRDEALPILEARLRAGELHVSVGDRVETFRRADWPDFDALVAAFREHALAAPPPDPALALVGLDDA